MGASSAHRPVHRPESSVTLIASVSSSQALTAAGAAQTDVAAGAAQSATALICERRTVLGQRPVGWRHRDAPHALMGYQGSAEPPRQIDGFGLREHLGQNW